MLELWPGSPYEKELNIFYFTVKLDFTGLIENPKREHLFFFWTLCVANEITENVAAPLSRDANKNEDNNDHEVR